MVTDGLRHRLMDPMMFHEFAEAFAVECNRHIAETERDRGGKLRELAQVRSKLDKLVDAVANGLKSTTIQAKLTSLEDQEAALQREMERPDAPVVRMTPDLAHLCSSEIDRLGERHETGDVATSDRELLRGLIDRVTITPATDTTELSIELEGDIVSMIGLAQNAESGRKRELNAAERSVFAGSVKVVAGTGFEPVTFRL